MQVEIDIRAFRHMTHLSRRFVANAGKQMGRVGLWGLLGAVAQEVEDEITAEGLMEDRRPEVRRYDVAEVLPTVELRCAAVFWCDLALAWATGEDAAVADPALEMMAGILREGIEGWMRAAGEGPALDHFSTWARKHGGAELLAEAAAAVRR